MTRAPDPAATAQLAPREVHRRDPRRRALTSAAGLRRIVLGSDQGECSVTSGAAQASGSKALRSAGPFSRSIVVVAHAERGAFDDWARQLLAAAAILAGSDTQVSALVFGQCRQADSELAALGVDRLLALDAFDNQRYQPGAQLRCLQAVRARLQPRPAHWLFADGAAAGDLGRRFAIDAGLELACGVLELGRERLRVAAGPDTDWLCAHAPVLLLAKGLVDCALPFVGQGLRADLAAALPQWPALCALPESGIEDLGVQAGDAQTLALEEAELILAAGNGVTDLALFHELARALGAAVGASRAAVDDGRFARAQQIGATGKTVGAAGYLALGISGAVQHLQGIRDCRHVIAVNRDAAAPIARRANLTLVEDSSALMRELLALLRARNDRHSADTAGGGA